METNDAWNEVECFWCHRMISWSYQLNAWGVWCSGRGNTWFDLQCTVGHSHEPIVNDD